MTQNNKANQAKPQNEQDPKAAPRGFFNTHEDLQKLPALPFHIEGLADYRRSDAKSV